MSPRRIVFVLIAVLASAATVFVGRAWFQAQPPVQVAAPAVAPPVESGKKVLVAVGNLPTGTFLKPENVRWAPWPADAATASYFVSDKDTVEDLYKSVLRSGVTDGEPITQSRVVRYGDRGFLAAALTPGYRAVTINVAPNSGGVGFIVPGDKIDLLVTMKVKDQKQKGQQGEDEVTHHVSETLIPDLRVLALDQRVDDEKKEVITAKTVTLEVTPKQAEIIAVAQEIGTLSLSLRSLPQSEADVAATTVGNAGLTYTFDSEATQILRPPSFNIVTQRVVVVRGDKESLIEFQRSTQ